MCTKISRALCSVLSMFAGLLLATSPAHATLIAYEGFDYTSGTDIRGQSGGSGWVAGNSWSGYDPSVTWPGLVTSSGLSYGNLATQGKALTTATTPGTIPPPSSALYWRNLPSFGQEDSTLYISFLFRPETGYGYYGGINLNDDFGRGIYVGKSGAPGYSNYGLEGPLNDIDSSSVPVTEGETAFIILKAQYLAGNDIYSIFVDPVLDGLEPEEPSAIKTDYDPVPGETLAGSTLTFNNFGYYTIDEIRIGTTYADVMPTGAPIPEPNSIALIAIGLTALTVSSRINNTGALRN